METPELTVVEYFASQALIGLLSRRAQGYLPPSELAHQAFEIGEAMCMEALKHYEIGDAP